MSRVYHFSLPDITCIKCVEPILAALKKYKKVLPIERIAESVTDKTIAITVADTEKYTPEAITEMLRNEIKSTGRRCENIGYVQEIKLLPHLLKGIIGTALGIIIMALMMSGVGIPLLVMYGLMAATTAGTLYLGAESYKETVVNLVKAKTLTMDSLFTVSTLTIIGVTIASFFVPGLPMMMEAGLMIFGFRHIGKVIEESLKKNVLSGLKFKDRSARVVKKVCENENLEEVESEDIKKGDVIVVSKGEVIPIDGECLDDVTSVYDTILTGATLPRKIKRGAKIIAGMKVPDDVSGIKIKVTATAENSYLARLDEKILQANADKAPIENTTHKILQYFIPGVLGVAALAGIAVGIFLNPALAIQLVATILVTACPCTFGFVIPFSMKLGMTKANENHIEFNNGKAVQAATQIDTLAFDLNGTLTTGTPKVTRYKILSKQISSKDFLDLLATIESSSKHPIARAISDFVENKNIPHNNSYELSDVDLSNHSGVQAMLNGERLVIGNQKRMQELGLNVPNIPNQGPEQIIFLAKGDTILGYIALTDPLRDDAKEAIETAQKLGKKVYLITGASQATAEYYAQQASIPAENVFGDCVNNSDNPSVRSKAQYIENLQKQGRHVAMIGDGGNDAHAIAKSNFGIAIKSNTADVVAQDQADVVINDGKIISVLTTLEIAKQTMRNIKESLIMSLTYNTGLMIFGGIAVAVGFAINPGLGVALMILQTSLVLLNQYRFRKKAISLPTLPGPKPSEASPSPDMISSYQHLYETGLSFSSSPQVKPVSDNNQSDFNNEQQDRSHPLWHSPFPLHDETIPTLGSPRASHS